METLWNMIQKERKSQRNSDKIIYEQLKKCTNFEDIIKGSLYLVPLGKIKQNKIPY